MEGSSSVGSGGDSTTRLKETPSFKRKGKSPFGSVTTQEGRNLVAGQGKPLNTAMTERDVEAFPPDRKHFRDDVSEPDDDGSIYDYDCFDVGEFDEEGNPVCEEQEVQQEQTEYDRPLPSLNSRVREESDNVSEADSAYVSDPESDFRVPKPKGESNEGAAPLGSFVFEPKRQPATQESSAKFTKPATVSATSDKHKEPSELTPKKSKLSALGDWFSKHKSKFYTVGGAALFAGGVAAAIFVPVGGAILLVAAVQVTATGKALFVYGIVDFDFSLSSGAPSSRSDDGKDGKKPESSVNTNNSSEAAKSENHPKPGEGVEPDASPTPNQAMEKEREDKKKEIEKERQKLGKPEQEVVEKFLKDAATQAFFEQGVTAGLVNSASTSPDDEKKLRSKLPKPIAKPINDDRVLQNACPIPM